MLHCFCSIVCFAPAALAAPSMQQPVVTNTGFSRPSSTLQSPSPGPGRAFRVREFSQGGQDLNADGDANDHVVAIVPEGAGPTLLVPLASDSIGPAQVGDWVVVAVPEDGQGSQDLNGDGDVLESVLHLIRADTGAATNTGMACDGARLALSEDYVAFSVKESFQGATDLNGDGDEFDDVLHYIELSTGTLTNVGLHVSSVSVSGSLISGQILESQDDLNGDGDTNDLFPYLFDISTGNLHVLTSSNISSIRTQDQYAAYTLQESAVGLDLNGDGDLGDNVLQVHDVASATVSNTGLALNNPLHDPLYTTDGPFLTFTVGEAKQQQDLNGDGDQADLVVHYVHLPTATAFNTGLAGIIHRGRGRLLVVRVNEVLQGGQDLNADGDTTDDSVLHVVRMGNGSVTNLGHQAYAVSTVGWLVGYMRFEPGEGTDLNGDGDIADTVLQLYDAGSGVTTNLGFEGAFPLAPNQKGEDFLICTRSEVGTGPATDLNGDGDAQDTVLHVLSAGQPPLNIGLDSDGAVLLRGRRVIFAVREFKQGFDDLNGDGDEVDWVVHHLDVP